MIDKRDGSHAGHVVVTIESNLDTMREGMSEVMRALLLWCDREIEAAADALLAEARQLDTAERSLQRQLSEEIRGRESEYRAAVEERQRPLDRLRARAQSRVSTGQALERRLRRFEDSDVAPFPAFVSVAQEVSTRVREGLEIRAAAPVPNEVVPEFHRLKYRFHRYQGLADARPMITEPTALDGCRWRVKLYPYGVGERQAGEAEYAALFVEMVRGPSEPTMATFRVSVGPIERELTSEVRLGVPFGWSRFRQAEALQRPPFIDQAGALLVVVQIRAESYYVLWKWLQSGIAYEEQQAGGTTERRTRAIPRVLTSPGP